MKLVKIFSDGQFKNVIFNNEYNIVLATIHDKENKKNTHNLISVPLKSGPVKY